jgi:hypothetical protein
MREAEMTKLKIIQAAFSKFIGLMTGVATLISVMSWIVDLCHHFLH